MLNNGQSIGNPTRGYKLNFSPGISDVVHEFCGNHNISGAECPLCLKPSIRLLSLDARDSRLNVDFARFASIPLLYCWTCRVPYGEFVYKVLSDGGVQIISVPTKDPRMDEFGPAGPYDGYTGQFPLSRVSLEPLSDAEQEQLVAMQMPGAETDYDAYFGHQIGGFPFYSQSAESVMSELQKRNAADCVHL